MEAAARITVNELKEKKPELLGKIDIDKLLPGIKKYNAQVNWSSIEDVNQLLATVTGENVEDINNLKDMSMFYFYNQLQKIFMEVLNLPSFFFFDHS